MTTSSSVVALPFLEENLADMLLTAAQDVFTSMLGSELQRLPGAAASRAQPFDGVLCLIGVAGPFIGNGTLLCVAETACHLSSRLLSAEFTHVDEQVLDAIGEIGNMVVGGFKNLLEPSVGEMKMSIPSVIYGKNIATRNPQADVTATVRCAFPEGELELTVRLAKARR